MRVLVSGASGFLGLHIVQRLIASGHEVTALARTVSKLGSFGDHAKVNPLEVDLNDERRVEAALSGQECCIHAAIIWGKPGDEFELRDTVASAKLFHAASRAGVRTTVYVSSTAVHRPFCSQMTASDRLTPEDMYGATKAAGELFLWAATAGQAMNGLVVRAGPIVGPPAFPGAAFKSPSRLEHMVKDARRGEPIQVAEGAGRQFAGVSAVAASVCKLAVEPRGTGNETYLCVDGEVTSWETVARKVVAVMRSTSAVVVEPAEAGTGFLPRFDGGLLVDRTGVEMDSSEAMGAHLAHLVRVTPRF